VSIASPWDVLTIRCLYDCLHNNVPTIRVLSPVSVSSTGAPPKVCVTARPDRAGQLLSNRLCQALMCVAGHVLHAREASLLETTDKRLPCLLGLSKRRMEPQNFSLALPFGSNGDQNRRRAAPLQRRTLGDLPSPFCIASKNANGQPSQAGARPGPEPARLESLVSRSSVRLFKFKSVPAGPSRDLPDLTRGNTLVDLTPFGSKPEPSSSALAGRAARPEKPPPCARGTPGASRPMRVVSSRSQEPFR
jgi:hypothetical protein